MKKDKPGTFGLFIAFKRAIYVFCKKTLPRSQLLLE